MNKTSQSFAGLLFLLFPVSCMTMQTELPGVLDLRTDLAKPGDQRLEPKEPAFGRSDQSFLQGFTLGSSNELPSQGLYQHPKAASDASALPQKLRSSLYRRVVRQWYLLKLLPVAGDQGLFAADLQTELSIPGRRLRKIRITSGQDIAQNLSPCVPIIGGFLQLVPTRTTEIVAYIDQPVQNQAPAADDGIVLVPVPQKATPPGATEEPQQATAASSTPAHLAQPPAEGAAP